MHQNPPRRNSLLTLALVAVVLVSCSHRRAVFNEETRVSAGYSATHFYEITPGMSLSEVRALIGEPLAVSTQRWAEVWSYRPPHTELIEPRGKRGDVLKYSINAIGTLLYFSESGIVLGTSGNYLSNNLTGLKKREVIPLVGEPTERDLTQFEIIYHYTRPGRSGTYKMRQVHFNEANKVVSTVADIYYD